MPDLPFQPLSRQASCKVAQLTPKTQTLLAYLAERFTYLTSDQWREQILAGSLTCNGHKTAAEEVLQADDVLQFQTRSLTEPPVSWDIDILHEDQDSLIVVKPGCLPCHPAGPFFNHTLWAWLKQQHGLPDIFFCHRLDRETSGLVVIGKTAAVAAEISRSLQSAEARKEYLVIVHGEFPSEDYCQGWIYPASDSAIRKKRSFSRQEPPAHLPHKSAATYFRRLASNNWSSLLLARLETGRTHQIRATLCSLGYPVVGDKLYGLDEQLFLRQAQDALSCEDYALLRLPRQALHATHLAFTRPGRTLEEYHSPLPADLKTPCLASIIVPAKIG